MSDVENPRAAGSSSSSIRPDAQRNRQRIVEAARELYAAEGLDISMSAVARKAGVGKATLFRHFSTTEQLIDEVFLDRMEEYAEADGKALALDDPWQGFISYVFSVCAMQARDRGFADLLTLTFPSDRAIEKHRSTAHEAFVEIIDRAKETGFLRADFASEDLVLVLMANAGVIAATRKDSPDSWRRLVGHLLRGFAHPDAPLPAMPPAPSSEDLYLAMARFQG